MNDGKTFEDLQWENKWPMKFTLYKGVTGKLGALRLQLKTPYQPRRDGTRDKPEGCVFLEMAPAVGNNVYDWKNSKITIALNVTDIPKVLMYLRAPGHKMFKKTDGKLKIYHDRRAGTADRGKDVTSLEFDCPPDKDNMFVRAFQKRNGSQKTATITISPDEALAMGTLLQAAIPTILAWR
ncbi:MAG: hypothetical protein ACXABY_12400 [Candidatus Thorarchaeota archaeon]